MFELLSMLPIPQVRHAMVVHVPIAAALLGLLPLALAACTGFRSVSMRGAAIGCMLIASAGGLAAAHTGRQAAEKVRAEQAPLAPHEEETLQRHEARGGITWIFPLIPAALLGATFARRCPGRKLVGGLALATAVGVAIWFCLVAGVGGKLVYEHGLGVPEREPYQGPVPAAGID